MTPVDLVVVACCIAADVLTGLVSAWVTHSFESGKMREGAGHKLGELFALGLTYGIQYGLPLIGVTTSINFVRFFTIYIVIMEFSSVCENVIKMDPEMKGPLGSLSKTLKEVLNRHE